MIHSIKTDLNRINFHDAQLKKVIRVDGKTVAEFDGAYLSHYSESDIEEPIIIGKCNLVVEGISNEEFRLYSDSKYHIENIPENVGEYWGEIQNTEIDDEGRLMKFDGIYIENKVRTFWTEWQFEFKNAELHWRKYSTAKEWETGKIPE